MADDEDSTLKKIAGLFVKIDEDAAQQEEQPPSEGEESATALTPPPPGDIEGDSSAVMTVDFGTLYDKTGVTGDPNTDPLLNAFAGMSSLAESPLRTAMDAMMRAMHANPSTVSETLTRRMGVLTMALQQQQDKLAQQKQQRTTNLATLRSTTEKDIRDLEQRIASLKAQIAENEEQTRQQDAQDQGTLAGFEQRVIQEQARLQTLKDFLEKTTGQPPGTAKRERGGDR